MNISLKGTGKEKIFDVISIVFGTFAASTTEDHSVAYDAPDCPPGRVYLWIRRRMRCCWGAQLLPSNRTVAYLVTATPPEEVALRLLVRRHPRRCHASTKPKASVSRVAVRRPLL